MILANTPLRISLFGGSTDNPKFIEKYGYGSVISFTCDLKTYVTLHEDKIGYNKHLKKYIINYSIREESVNIKNIQNEVVRIVLECFSVDPMTISLTSDVYSQGSGLASSSSYIISLIKAISIKLGLNMSDTEICDLAYSLELKINPFCGLQDSFGCGIGGFKRLEFEKNNKVKFSFFSTDFFNIFDCYLIFTGIYRNSKLVLSDVSNNVDKIYDLLPIVDDADVAIRNNNYNTLMDLIKESWKIKKTTSNFILENNNLKLIDDTLEKNESVLAHKLCGAGNGGFFLVFSKKNNFNIELPYVKINNCVSGVTGVII